MKDNKRKIHIQCAERVSMFLLVLLILKQQRFVYVNFKLVHFCDLKEVILLIIVDVLHQRFPLDSRKYEIILFVILHCLQCQICNSCRSLLPINSIYGINELIFMDKINM